VLVVHVTRKAGDMPTYRDKSGLNESLGYSLVESGCCGLPMCQQIRHNARLFINTLGS
jgi:hypothetical protein